MRASHWRATFVAGTAFAISIFALAQGQLPPGTGRPPAGAPAAPAASAPPRGTNVAVIDVKFIFDNHAQFKATMESIKKEYDAFEAQVRETEATLKKQIEQLKTLQQGSPQYKQIEEQVTQTRAGVQLDINRRQKERVDDEARVYHRAYQDLEAAVKDFSNRYGIDLVLQFNSAEIDPSKPDTVIRGLNRLVVYQNQLNITTEILRELNGRGPQPQATNPVRPTGPAPTGGVPGRTNQAVPSFPKNR